MLYNELLFEETGENPVRARRREAINCICSFMPQHKEKVIVNNEKTAYILPSRNIQITKYSCPFASADKE